MGYLFINLHVSGGTKVSVEPHRHEGVYVARSAKEDVIVTKNFAPGESVYGEKRIEVPVSCAFHH